MVRLDILHIFEKFAKKNDRVRTAPWSSIVLSMVVVKFWANLKCHFSRGSTFRSPTTLIGFIGDFLVMYTQEIHFYCKI